MKKCKNVNGSCETFYIGNENDKYKNNELQDIYKTGKWFYCDNHLNNDADERFQQASLISFVEILVMEQKVLKKFIVVWIQ